MAMTIGKNEPHEFGLRRELQRRIEPALESDRRARLAAQPFAARGTAEVRGEDFDVVGELQQLSVDAVVELLGGGYLVWLWWRDGRGWPLGAFGAVVLVLYGIIPTYQPAHFGRVYAAYGGVFAAIQGRRARRAARPRPRH